MLETVHLRRDLLLERSVRPGRVFRVVSRFNLEHALVVQGCHPAKRFRFISCLVSGRGSVPNAHRFDDETKAKMISDTNPYINDSAKRGVGGD